MSASATASRETQHRRERDKANLVISPTGNISNNSQHGAVLATIQSSIDENSTSGASSDVASLPTRTINYFSSADDEGELGSGMGRSRLSRENESEGKHGTDRKGYKCIVIYD